MFKKTFTLIFLTTFCNYIFSMNTKEPFFLTIAEAIIKKKDFAIDQEEKTEHYYVSSFTIKNGCLTSPTNSITFNGKVIIPYSAGFTLPYFLSCSDTTLNIIYLSTELNGYTTQTIRLDNYYPNISLKDKRLKLSATTNAEGTQTFSLEYKTISNEPEPITLISNINFTDSPHFKSMKCHVTSSSTWTKLKTIPLGRSLLDSALLLDSLSTPSEDPSKENRYFLFTVYTVGGLCIFAFLLAAGGYLYKNSFKPTKNSYFKLFQQPCLFSKSIILKTTRGLHGND